MSWQFRSLCSLTHRNSDICVKYHLLFAHCSMKYQQFKNISMSYHLELLSSLLANCMLANTGAQRECPVNFHSKWLVMDRVTPGVSVFWLLLKERVSRSVWNSLWPPWTVAHHAPLSMGFSRQAGCHSLLQGIFPTQESNPVLLHCRQILYHLSH